MNDPIILIVCTAALTAVLPVSVAVLFAILTRHVQLAPASAADSAVVERFDSEAERAAFHADMAARTEARKAEVLARYHRALQAALAHGDPRVEQQWRHTESAPAEAPADEAEVHPAEHATASSVTPIEAATALPTRRIGPWRARLLSARGNGSPA